MSTTSPVRPAPPIEVQLLEAPFQPLERLAAWQRSLAAEGPDATGSAAESHFIGRVRPTTAAGEPLEALELEHYPGMTEAQLRSLAEACAARHGAGAVLVAHRVGRVRPGEAIVLVAVQADRRGPALRCVQELLEDLKHHAPFWKREWSGGSGTWVAGNTPL
ncbi:MULTISPECIES: molybdenum cofactor biosynthesis protein MoaE [unclassified Synechococcus]|uniref:molybdopterin synthase catalytic subunit n=1 Tax=unclassified Synechococcus TaxID=2626047 RepID=UPI001C246563|nr:MULTISPECIES: molybdenum cofactor biosynthesis protein MoaE [unclassified Synechococcus]